MRRALTIRLALIVALALLIYGGVRLAGAASRIAPRHDPVAIDFELERSARMQAIDLQVIKYKRAIDLLRRREECYAEAHDMRELASC